MPDSRRIARGYAATRVLAGLALLTAPGAALGAMVRPGEVTPAARFAARLLGGRDLLLGAGALASLGDGDQLRRWMLVGAAADAADAVAVGLAFGDLRRTTRLAVLGAALAGAATGAHVWYRLG